VVIGLSWALIIAGAMRITDGLGVRRRYAPFVDAVLAISLDLAFDAIAIRMGLWTWRGIGPSQGWFGVPAGNFYAWLFVTLGFSTVTRWLRESAGAHPARAWLQLAVPIPAYLILLVGLVPFSILRDWLDPVPGGGLALFAVALAAFAGVAAWGVWGRDRARPDGERMAMVELGVAFGSRIAIHLFFLGGLLALGIVFRTPMLGVVAVALLAAELPLARLVHGRQAIGIVRPAAPASSTRAVEPS